MGHQPYPARTNHEVFEFVIHGGRNEKQEGMSSFMYVCTAWGSDTLVKCSVDAVTTMDDGLI